MVDGSDIPLIFATRPRVMKPTQLMFIGKFYQLIFNNIGKEGMSSLALAKE